MKTFKEIREAYGPAAPKMKRSRSAGSGGDKYVVKYQGGKNTVYANSPEDALKKSMKFFDVGPVGKDRYMKNATAIAESVTEASKVPAGRKFIASYVYKGGDGKDHKHTHYRKGNKMTDPVVVHIDDKEWKEFSSFTKAKQGAINHIKGMKKSVAEGFMDDYKAMKAKGSNYQIYHKTYSDAVQHAVNHVFDKMGYEVDSQDFFNKVSSGPRKPSPGKTNSFSIDLFDKKTGKPVRQKLHMQVYGMDSGKYELNMYVT